MQNFTNVFESIFKPMSLNDDLSTFRNIYVNAIVNIGPIELEKKLPGGSKIDRIFRIPVTVAQNRTTLKIISILDLEFIIFIFESNQVIVFDIL